MQGVLQINEPIYIKETRTEKEEEVTRWIKKDPEKKKGYLKDEHLRKKHARVDSFIQSSNQPASCQSPNEPFKCQVAKPTFKLPVI